VAQESAKEVSDRIIGVLQSVYGQAERFIPLHEPEFRGNEWVYLKDCVDTGWVSSVGSYVDRIEQDLATITQSRNATACVNGTAALHICYLLAGIARGDEVLVPSLTFIATVNPLSYLGAIPHFVDSSPETLAVDPAALDKYLEAIAELRDGRCFNSTSGASISALVVTHIFGHAADLDALLHVCAKWSLVLVEDAAEALGTRYKGRHVGNHGLISAISFNGNKIITTGGGGLFSPMIQTSQNGRNISLLQPKYPTLGILYMTRLPSTIECRISMRRSVVHSSNSCQTCFGANSFWQVGCLSLSKRWRAYASSASQGTARAITGLTRLQLKVSPSKRVTKFWQRSMKRTICRGLFGH
jgi:hypothetical protein